MASNKPDRKLSPKQEMFAQEYAVDLNGTQAAIRAGYSAKTADVKAAFLIRNDLVQRKIQELLQARQERTQITADYVLSTIRDTVERAVADDDRQSIFKGSELLGKHLKLFTDKVEHGGQDGKNLFDSVAFVLVRPENENG